MMDTHHPRSIAYQLHQLSAHIGELPRERGKAHLSEEERLILKAYSDIRLANVSELLQINDDSEVYSDLDTLLSNTTDLLWRIAEVIGQAYFSHSQTSQLITPKAPEDEP